MDKKVVIIGAGLAGLCTGIELQKQGISTEIYELSAFTGGVFSSWVRKGYRFDGCIHWMVGTKTGTAMNKLYREFDLLTDQTKIYNAPYLEFEIDGEMVQVPMEITAFRRFLTDLSPADELVINELCDDIEVMAKSDLIAETPEGFFAIVKFIFKNGGLLKIMRKYLNLSMADVTENIQSSLIKKLFYLFLPPNFSAEAFIMMMGTRLGNNAGYPLGGSLEALKRIEAKYVSLGGVIHVNSKVDEIIVENGNATGIVSKGKTVPADGVVAACDAYDTLKYMLKGQFKHPQLDDMLVHAPLFPAEMLVSFGLDKTFPISYTMHLECKNGFEVAPDQFEYSLTVRSFDFDSSASPAGGSSVMALFTAPLEYWQNLRHTDIEAYRRKKDELASAVAEFLDTRFPGFKDAVIVTDVATPATYVRLANLYKGSFEGFLPTVEAVKKRIQLTIPGINNLVLTGQWTTTGGGIPPAVAGGKKAARVLIKKIK